MKKATAIIIIIIIILGLVALNAFYVRSDEHRDKVMDETFQEVCSNKLDKNGNFDGDEEIEFVKCRNNVCYWSNEENGKSYKYNCNGENPEFEVDTD